MMEAEKARMEVLDARNEIFLFVTNSGLDDSAHCNDEPELSTLLCHEAIKLAHVPGPIASPTTPTAINQSTPQAVEPVDLGHISSMHLASAADNPIPQGPTTSAVAIQTSTVVSSSIPPPGPIRSDNEPVCQQVASSITQPSSPAAPLSIIQQRVSVQLSPFRMLPYSRKNHSEPPLELEESQSQSGCSKYRELDRDRSETWNLPQQRHIEQLYRERDIRRMKEAQGIE